MPVGPVQRHLLDDLRFDRHHFAAAPARQIVVLEATGDAIVLPLVLRIQIAGLHQPQFHEKFQVAVDGSQAGITLVLAGQCVDLVGIQEGLVRAQQIQQQQPLGSQAMAGLADQRFRFFRGGNLEYRVAHRLPRWTLRLCSLSEDPPPQASRSLLAAAPGGRCRTDCACPDYRPGSAGQQWFSWLIVYRATPEMPTSGRP